MDALTITSIIGVAVAAVSTIVIPAYLAHRRRRTNLDSTEVLNWDLMNKSIAKERDDLRKRLDEIDDHYIARIKELRDDWEAQMSAARARIRGLEDEVGALRRALRGGDPA